jgi:hypothetical protein
MNAYGVTIHMEENGNSRNSVDFERIKESKSWEPLKPSTPHIILSLKYDGYENRNKDLDVNMVET